MLLFYFKVMMSLYKFYIPTLKYITKNLIIEENEKKKKKPWMLMGV